MKKLSAIIILLLTLIFITSCITVNGTFKLSQSELNITSIEIYKTEEMYDLGNIHFLRDENTPICIIPLQMQEKFINEIESLMYKKEVLLFPIPMDGGFETIGYVIAIVYKDGSYDIVAYNGYFSYTLKANGDERYKYDYSDYCGDEPWDSIIEKYIEKK